VQSRLEALKKWGRLPKACGRSGLASATRDATEPFGSGTFRETIAAGFAHRRGARSSRVDCYGSSALGAGSLRMGHDAQAIVDRVKALAAGQLGDRFHELVDKRLLGTMDFTELFELECIEARLDTEDRDEAARLTVLGDRSLSTGLEIP
jgi:hypothetical protein